MRLARFKPWIADTRPSPAFTLIELLVVVTIIVLLLALLTPALDKAIYQAELAVCGARLDAFGAHLVAGAVQRQRRYPDRTIRGLPMTVSYNGADDRPTLRGYLGNSLNATLQDPLTKPVEIDGSQSTTSAQIGYALWFGWRNPLGPTPKKGLEQGMTTQLASHFEKLRTRRGLRHG